MFVSIRQLPAGGAEITDTDFVQKFAWSRERGCYIYPDDPSKKVSMPLFLDVYEQRGFDDEYIARNLVLAINYLAERRYGSISELCSTYIIDPRFDKYRPTIEKLLLLA